MKIRKTQNELVLSETPGALWTFGFFFVLVGMTFVYGSLGGYSNYAEATRWAIALHFLGGIVAVATGFWVILKAPVITITIDRLSEVVRIKRRGLGGRSDRIYSFVEVLQFYVIEEIDSDGDPIFSLGLERANGKTFKLSSIASPVENINRDFAFEINEFMQKQMPSYKSHFEVEGEID